MVEEWQPIETAPGSGVMLVTDGISVVPAEAYDPEDAEVGLWDLTVWNYDGNGDVQFKPTHWMPLPDPPSVEQPAPKAL